MLGFNIYNKYMYVVKRREQGDHERWRRVKKRKRVSGIKHHVILLGERISLKPANENKPVAAIFIIVIIIIIFFFLSLVGSE